MDDAKAGKTLGLKKRWTSRKFWMVNILIVLSTIVPLIFKASGISENVTMLVLGTYGAVGSIYGIVNTLDKKWNGTDR